MDERATGLVLRTRLHSETSLLVHWLTRDSGRLRTVAKGARRPKSPFLGKIDLCYLADFTFHRNRHSDWHILREITVLDFHNALRGDIGYLSQAAYFAHLVEQTTELETPLPGVFGLLAEALQAFTAGPPHPVAVYSFEMKLLQELGLMPDLAQARLSPGVMEILGRLATVDWGLVSRFQATAAQHQEMERFLEEFLTYHFGSVRRSREQALRKW